MNVIRERLFPGGEDEKGQSEFAQGHGSGERHLPRVRKIKKIIEFLFMHALLALHFFPKLVAFTPYPSQHDLRQIGLVGMSTAEERKLRV
jgi:hypothetical protein